MTPPRLRGGVRQVGGARLVHLTAGDGPPVVFAHGGLGRGSGWLGVTDRLADVVTCHLLDLRGHGASDWGDGPDLEAAAADVLDAVRTLGPVHALVGHSYGALVALEAARLAAPGEIPRLVVYEPPLAVSGPIVDEARLAEIDACVADGDYEGALLAHLRGPAGGLAEAEIELLRAVPELRGAYADLVIQAPAIGPGLRVANALDRADRYAAVTGEVTVLLGSESPEQPFGSAAAALAAALGDARIVALEGQGHLANLRAPELVAGAIRAACA
jgi:pimeloyl-ACP methyl ester carboxylesterase